jgi:uncharacterized protein GlcG (DUF336 family)
VAVACVTGGVLLAVVATVGGAVAVAGHTVRIDASGNLANKATGITAIAQAGLLREYWRACWPG